MRIRSLISFEEAKLLKEKNDQKLAQKALSSDENKKSDFKPIHNQDKSRCDRWTDCLLSLFGLSIQRKDHSIKPIEEEL